MTKVRIIALLGSASSGKSTVAQYLVRKHGFTRFRFAQPLKTMLLSIGLSHEQVDGSQEVKETPCDLLCGKTPRHAMQTLGTEWRNTISKHLWARITRFSIADFVRSLAHLETPINIVVDDMRFIHEPDELAKLADDFDLELIVLAIRRPCVEPTLLERYAARVPATSLMRRVGHILFGIRPLHLSEVTWFRMGRTADIYNDGTVAALYRQVDGHI